METVLRLWPYIPLRATICQQTDGLKSIPQTEGKYPASLGMKFGQYVVHLPESATNQKVNINKYHNL